MHGGPDSGRRGDSTARRGKPWLPFVAWTAVFAGLYVVQLFNFLLFHSLAEVFSIVIASAVFLVAWNSRARMDTDFFLILGVAYAAVAVLDTFHTLAYAGMGVFPGRGANLSTQLWLAARFVEAGSLVVATGFVGDNAASARLSFSRRSRDTALLVAGYVAVTAAFLVGIFGGSFPTSYVPESGLTTFKVVAEYAIVALLGVSLVQLYRHRGGLDRRVYGYFVVGIGVTIVSELFFTTYISVYGFSAMVGHLLKIASFYLIYLAGVKTVISNPQEVLFRQLHEERDRLADREAELARKNRRLDQFAGIVSHDLRNPLNVASGRIELARAEADGDGGDDEHLAAAADAIDRMATLIDDVLALAREGESVDEAAPVDTESLARASWRTVDTADAELRVDGPGAVRADQARLRRLFENLFRNAVEHGGEAPTVRVGALPDGRGFFVEDDGPGVPPDDREAVFEAGYSTAAEGTGFGLNIVREIAHAHDWTVTVGESASGGARFEITGVDAADSTEPAAGESPPVTE
ncbi:MASE3 domain-containing protein [Candidatus Halobonum tyrrellensis]|uniref:histidine kinase n=1 Tax=Candidatus Halobonum tyrrellensis G22 TaxID=1324957 RepID=V4HDH7_9EURY|nr:MASE3 domain-containing protein [Candidatus Halobonum tyrrellensis]ESP88128.1 integral membrane sensor signal transduction histidine kinase [Candidatus Halobonum tyrrellensis G22]